MQQNNQDFVHWPLTRGWPLNTGPLYTGWTLHVLGSASVKVKFSPCLVEYCVFFRTRFLILDQNDGD